MIARLTNTVWLAAVLLTILAIAFFVMVAGKLAHAQQTNLGPFQTSITVTTVLQTAAIPANPSRRGLIICNGNATGTNNVYVGFGSVVPTVGTGLIIPGGFVPASCFTTPLGIGGGLAGGIGAQINLIATASTVVTVLEF